MMPSLDASVSANPLPRSPASPPKNNPYAEYALLGLFLTAVSAIECSRELAERSNALADPIFRRAPDKMPFWRYTFDTAQFYLPYFPSLL